MPKLDRSREIDVGGTHPLHLEHRDGFLVVRDDLIPGGTKARVIHNLFDDQHSQYVYASPVQGYAQVAMAHACREHGKVAVVFCAKRGKKHPTTLLAEAAGAITIDVDPPAYLNVVQVRARQYVEATPEAKLLPLGLGCPEIKNALADIARRLSEQIGEPKEVWTVASSGTLSLSLQQAWPNAVVHAVRVGMVRDLGRALIHKAPEKYEQKAKMPPPFPSCLTYDSKAWRFVKELASPGALFWNVA
jgi:hypothetical protein